MLVKTTFLNFIFTELIDLNDFAISLFVVTCKKIQGKWNLRHPFLLHVLFYHFTIFQIINFILEAYRVTIRIEASLYYVLLSAIL